MKRSTLRKKSKTSVAKLKNKLWELCRKVALILYPHKCFTCDTPLQAGTSNMQLGHFIPSSTCGAFLRYDLRNLRWQCMRCNVHGGGQGAIFYKRLVETEGQEYVDTLFQDKQKIVKADAQFYEDLIEKAENILQSF